MSSPLTTPPVITGRRRPSVELHLSPPQPNFYHNSSSSSNNNNNNTKSPFVASTVPNPRRTRCISCSDNGNDILAVDNVAVADDDDGDDLVVEGMPDVIVTRRTRTQSLCGRIGDDVATGAVKYFCRSRGHGFITPDEGPHAELFVHVSDVEGEFVPRRGDRVTFRVCPIPPRFDRHQAVHVHIVAPSGEDEAVVGPRRRWDAPESPEEKAEKAATAGRLPYDV